MKFPWLSLLLAATIVPVLFAAVRSASPRPSIAQTLPPARQAPPPASILELRRRYPPLPAHLTPEQARTEIRRGRWYTLSGEERRRLFETGAVDWHSPASQGSDLVVRLSRPGLAPSPIKVRVFTKPPFDPSQLTPVPLYGGGPSENPPQWQGDSRLWFRVDGVDPRVIPDAHHPMPPYGGGFGGENAPGSHVWGEWRFGEGREFMDMRRTAKTPWQDARMLEMKWSGRSQLTRSELFNWNGTVWICLHVRSWGGGQWRYLIQPTLDVPFYFERTQSQLFPSNPFGGARMMLFPLRVETDAPVYGNSRLPPPWPRTRFDVVSPQQPLLRSLEYFDKSSKSWKAVPGRGQANFPLRLSEEEQVNFRAVRRNPARPWPDSPDVYPMWTATRDGIKVAQGSGEEQRYFSTYNVPDDKAINPPGYQKDLSEPQYPEWRVRPSTSNLDLMTIAASAGNTLQAQVYVLPRPTPTPTETPLPTMVPYQQEMGGVESLSAMRGTSFSGDSALWAVQKTPVGMTPQRFKARLWMDESVNLEDLKVVFHSRFTDGAPCGTWEAPQVSPTGERRVIEAVATFQPPAHAGLGYLWVGVSSRSKQKMASFKRAPFAVLPLALSCSTTPWEPTGQSNEWSREVHVFAKVEVPPAWKPALGGRGRPASGPFAELISELSYRTQPMVGIPIRLSLLPAPYLSANEVPPCRLSVVRGVTGTMAPSGKPLSGYSNLYMATAPRLVATQTVQWKLGNSNQIDASQVVAQLDLTDVSRTNQKDGTK